MNQADAFKRRSRSVLEALGWIALVTVLWGTDLLVRLKEQAGLGKDTFVLVSEQVTSALAVLALIPLVLYWTRLFPIRREQWVAAVIGHAAGTVLFAFGHYSLMVMLRIPWYASAGHDYVWREPFVSNLVLEYQKDIKIYLGIVALLTAYRLFRQSRAPKAPADRLVVQTGKGERILRFDEVDYLEAARNYVTIHVDDREYIVRETLSKLFERLADGPFLRCHRSFVVNVDKVRELRTIDGRQLVTLDSGAEVPLSRGYREAFTTQLAR